jgi:fimbrial isopeptide formation D2 family protein
MNRKIWINLILALLLITSTYPVIGTSQKRIIYNQFCPQEGFLDFSKSVWREDHWDDYIEDVEVGSTVRFNISLTYYENQENSNDWVLQDIVISDELPICLIFAENITFFNAPIIDEQQNGNIITWNFTGYEYNLSDEETMSIEFDATVVESQESENENIAYISAVEGGSYYLDDEDSAWVYVYVPPPPEPLVIVKQVYDPEVGEWVDYLDGVLKGTQVRFNVTITFNGYTGVNLMKCMKVHDCIPECCMDYAGNESFYFPSNLFENPDIIVSEDLKDVDFDWSNKLFNLYPNQTISIEFDTTVIYYCYDEIEKCASVNLWSCYSCSNPVHLYGYDCTTVNCVPPETTIEKKVKDPETGEWVKEAFQFVNETVTFKLELKYYGNYNLKNVKIVDNLPPITYYNNYTSILPINVSEDGKTLWWNISEPVEDGVPLNVIYDAFVWGSTGDCELCKINYAEYSAKENKTNHVYSGEDTAKITTNYYADPTLAYYPNYIDFGEQNQGWTGSAYFEIWNSGDQILTYSLSESLDWIQLDVTSGSSEGEHDTINVYVVNTENIYGYFSGNILISSNGGDGNVHINIYLNEKGPILSYSINNINFGEHDQGWTGSASFEIWNSGYQTLTYTLSETLDWIEINPTSGSSSGEHNTITIDVVNTGGLVGYNFGYISISSNGGDGKVYLHLYIRPVIPIQLEISVKKGLSISRVSAVIKNVGEADATNISWEFNITAGMLRKKPIAEDGTIGLIEINKNKKVNSGKLFGRSAIKLRFGRIRGYLQVNVDDFSTTKEFSGIILGRVIFILRSKTPV